MTSLALYTLGDAEGDWESAVANLHALATTIGEARKAGQTDAANALIPQFQYWLGQAKAAAQALYGQDMPSGLMQSLDDLAASVVGVVKTTGIVLLAAVAVGIVGWFFLKGKGASRGLAAPQKAG